MIRIIATVLAVDPGKQKCGIAVVNEKMMVFKKLITPSERLLKVAGDLCHEYKIAAIVLGNKTGSGDILKRLVTLALPVHLVDEDKSSIEGRYRYLKENTRGLACLIPIGLRIPGQPFDDYVAIILAERFFKNATYPGV